VEYLIVDKLTWTCIHSFTPISSTYCPAKLTYCPAKLTPSHPIPSLTLHIRHHCDLQTTMADTENSSQAGSFVSADERPQVTPRKSIRDRNPNARIVSASPAQRSQQAPVNVPAVNVPRGPGKRRTQVGDIHPNPIYKTSRSKSAPKAGKKSAKKSKSNANNSAPPRKVKAGMRTYSGKMLPRSFADVDR